MKETSVAQTYARALYLAVEGNKSVSQETVKKQLGELSKAIRTDARLKAALKNPLVSPLTKKTLLRKSFELFQQKPPELLINFLNLLVDKKRIDFLPFILNWFESAAMNARGSMKAFVKSASALDQKSKDEIKKKLSRLFGKEIFIETSTHPELLAGIVIQAGDTVIDNSLKNQLKNMKASISQ